mmetsp:Transcript_10908/g.18659  ORF Transcript_10908/g.18659 Transcript_10908/m.18659 type:complete len:102 (+) Transcript_10908:143-448(+)|eukprot:CAMPEP_0184691286 /NCGR_PEP_ID=MMETSP0313-20130426/181_1 /TAXON_ID=2792 /ORGANISM="Porphyridium aerugineum, Strain SAG 1380-2" /LENGTH=101 /DNA_ID=CAMNT_0027148967 /DNA_START=126 /DNA_END=431 /DNA_ORIENTATION=-
MAFVSGFSASTLVQTKSKIVSVNSKPAVARNNASVMKMQKIADEKKVSGPKKLAFGFTAENEKLNGRIAQLAFVLMLVTEIVSPTHASGLEQIKTMLPFLQ